MMSKQKTSFGVLLPLLIVFLWSCFYLLLQQQWKNQLLPKNFLLFHTNNNNNNTTSSGGATTTSTTTTSTTTTTATKKKNLSFAFTFPSVEERIKYYMGDWYNEVDDDDNDNDSSSSIVTTGSICDEVPICNHSCSKTVHGPWIYDYYNLNYVQRYTCGLGIKYYPVDAIRNYYYMNMYNNSNTTTITTTTSTNTSTAIAATARFLFRFSDDVPSPKSKSISKEWRYPTIVKARFAAAESAHYKEEASDSSISTTTNNNVKSNDNMNTNLKVQILGLLDEGRRFGGQLNEYLRLEKRQKLQLQRHQKKTNRTMMPEKEGWLIPPWEFKNDTLLWRGVSTGREKRRQIVKRFIDGDEEYNNSPRRNYPTIDIAFTKFVQGEEKFYDGDINRYLRPPLSVAEMVRHKYLLSIEGNDFATNLMWLLYSNSVVFMAQPTYVTWAMEDILVPYYHYIPIQQDGSDLREMLHWAHTHQNECQQISKHATQFVRDVYLSWQAKEDNTKILQGIVTRYQRLYGQALSKCTTIDNGSSRDPESVREFDNCDDDSSSEDYDDDDDDDHSDDD